MDYEMTFPEYRELLVHINKEHSPNKTSQGRVVMLIQNIVNMKTGKVFEVKMKGTGWTKTFIAGLGRKPLLQRCHDFLDGLASAEQPDTVEDAKTMKAAEVVMQILVGEFGRQCAIQGAEFGTKDLNFTIDRVVLQKAIAEIDNGKSTTGEN